jgi:hypothetical protein
VSSELTKWSLMDQRLIDCAANGLSAQEIERELDVPAAQAIVRIRELLRSRDIWSEVERKQLLIESLYKLKSKAERALDPDNPKSVEANMKILVELGKRLDVASQINESDLDRLTTMQAQKLLQLFVLAPDRAKDILQEAYPDGVIEDIDAALREGLRDAAAQIEG